MRCISTPHVDVGAVEEQVGIAGMVGSYVYVYHCEWSEHFDVPFVVHLGRLIGVRLQIIGPKSPKRSVVMFGVHIASEILPQR